MTKEVNIKAIYIMDFSCYGFTKGNTYIFTHIKYYENGSKCGCVYNDFGAMDFMNLKSFKLLSEIREEKLNKIFND